MTPRCGILTAFITLACLTALPTIVTAQSAITGVVRDTSGAVLPGVNVEASSDVLIEKARTVVTDGQGQYRIVDLRPGLYVVTFTLTGFQSMRREGVELPAEFTATINADMRVGALEESITVSGDAPVVDTTTAVHTQVLSRDTIDRLPSGRSIWSIGQLIVGVNLNTPDVGGSRSMQQTYMSTHGMTASNNTVMIDGMMVNGLQNNGQIQAYYNEAMNQEVSYQTSGIGAETSAGGVRLNMIPREGGNRFSGSFFSTTRPGAWQADNLTQRLRDRGLQSVGNIDKLYEVSVAEGGPFKKDKLWFFTAARFVRLDAPITDSFRDDGSPGVDDQYTRTALLRLTWQVSPRNKLSMHYDRIDKFRGHDHTAGTDYETASVVWWFPLVYQGTAKWTSTVTNRLLLDAGYSSYMGFYTNMYQDGIEQPAFTPQWYALASRADLDKGTRTTAAVVQNAQSPERYVVQSSATYVTGSHNFKTGFQWTFGEYRHTQSMNADLYQEYRSGVPDTVQIRNTPLRYAERLNADVGIYAQDSWKLKRLTVNMGLRWEYINSQVQAGVSPAGRFVPARTFPEVRNLPNWTDWAPRFAVVYDVFGDAKTALKYSLNRYNDAQTTGVAANYNPLASTTATLRWRDLNGDDIAQGDRGCVYQTQGCEIDFSTLAPNFGTAALNRYGEYPRTWNLEHGLEVQHELLPRLALTGSWFRGAFYNLTATVNQNLTRADYTPLPIFNPMDGTPVTIYNISPAAAGRPVDNLDTFDPQREKTYSAYNVEFKAQPGRGALLFGGLSFEREITVNCTAPDNPNSLRFCDGRENGLPYRKTFKISGSYPLPWGVRLSGVLQSQHGNATTINYSINRTLRYPADCPAPCPAGALVVGPALTASSLSVPLVPTNTEFFERINQLDIKLVKSFKAGRVSFEPTFEAFNVFNSDAIYSYRSTNFATPAFQQPSVVLNGRLVGVGLQARW